MRRPTLVRVSWPGGRTAAAAGRLPAASVRAAPSRSARAASPDRARGALPRAAPPPAQRTTRAVGIASLEVPGLAPGRRAHRGPLRAGCGSVTRRARAGARSPLRPRGSVADLDAGRPLRARACDGPVRMGEDVQRVRTLPGVFSVDLLRLSSPAPAPRPRGHRGRRRWSTQAGSATARSTASRVALDGPAWLVLGQSYSKGWRATCDGRSLGASAADQRLRQRVARAGRLPRAWPSPSRRRKRRRLGYVISAVVCLLLAVFLVAGGLREPRGREPRDAPPPPPASAGRAPGMPLPRAAAHRPGRDGPARAAVRAAHLGGHLPRADPRPLARCGRARARSPIAVVAARRGRAPALRDRLAARTAGATTSSTASS